MNDLVIELRAFADRYRKIGGRQWAGALDRAANQIEKLVEMEKERDEARAALKRLAKASAEFVDVGLCTCKQHPCVQVALSDALADPAVKAVLGD